MKSINLTKLEKVQFFKNFPLRPYNTFGIEARASVFSEVINTAGLLEVLEYVQTRQRELFVLGGGSNILLTGDVDKVVLKNSLGGIELIDQDHENVLVRVGGGVVWHDFVLHAVAMGWGGVENLSLIPGTVGASPIQNIGAYGVEMKDVFQVLEAVEVATGNSRQFDASDCRFGYRNSVFKGELKGAWIITSVTFRLSKSGVVNTSYGDIRSVLQSLGVDNPGIGDVSRAVIQIRQQKLPDPAIVGNAGSFFKNPEVSQTTFQQLKERYVRIPGYAVNDLVKVPAGWLIESAGWKGYREGRVGVHDRQALVLVNYGGATGMEIRRLAERIAESVGEMFGIILTPEVNYI